MKFTFWVAAAFAALGQPLLCLARANDTVPSADELTKSLLEVPSCALECLANAVINATCSPADPQCVCRDKFEEIDKLGTPCILSKCTLMEALSAKNISESVCNRPIRDKRSQYTAMNVSLGAITVIIVAIRLIFKKFFSYRRELGPDDWLIIVTVVIGIPCTIINQVGLLRYGLGRDVWTVTPDSITNFVMYFYIMEVLYLAEMSVIKLSLSLFYLNIFPGTTIRRLLMGTAIMNVLVGIAFVTTGIFQCTPVDRYWMKYTTDVGGHCINLNVFAWAHAAVNIALDVWMLAIPLSQIKRLELHWKKKVGVAFMFVIGTFVTVVSILRLQSLIYFASSTNPTWDQWIVAWWSTIEVNVGMICTCLPTLRLILVRAAPRIFSTNASRLTKSDAAHSRYGRNSHMGHKPIELASIETTTVEDMSAGEGSSGLGEKKRKNFFGS